MGDGNRAFPSPLVGQGSGRTGLGRFSVRDIVLVALLASVGGTLSAYVGYLGNLINRFFGVPFGAGQVLAGLHVLWPLLAAAVVGRFGAATLTGLVKGLVEFLMGGTHGLVILLVSFVEGAFVDLGSLAFGRSLPAFLLAGGVAAASNVFVFQTLYFSGVPWTYILFMAGLASVSGAILGGWLSHDLLSILQRAGVVRAPVMKTSRLRGWLAGGLALALAVGGAHYYLAVYEPFLPPDALRVEGKVEKPFRFVYGEWEEEEITLRATLEGAVTHVPEREYTGVPVGKILAHAGPLPSAQKLVTRARDGYFAEFPLPNALDPSLIVIQEGESLRLVAKGYSGSLWVQDLVALEVR